MKFSNPITKTATLAVALVACVGVVTAQGPGDGGPGANGAGPGGDDEWGDWEEEYEAPDIREAPPLQDGPYDDNGPEIRQGGPGYDDYTDDYVKDDYYEKEKDDKYYGDSYGKKDYGYDNKVCLVYICVRSRVLFLTQLYFLTEERLRVW